MDNGHPSWVAAFPRAINGVTPDNRGKLLAPAVPYRLHRAPQEKNTTTKTLCQDSFAYLFQRMMISVIQTPTCRKNPPLPRLCPIQPARYLCHTANSNPYPNRPRSVTRSTIPASKPCPNTSAILLPCRKSMGKVWENKENAPEIRLFARFRSVGGDCWYSPICAFPIFAVRILPNPYQKPPPQALSATISLSRSSDAQESMGRCMGEHLRVDETL